MKNMMHARKLLAVALSLGLTLGASQAFAAPQDMGAHKDHATKDHAADNINESKKPVTDTWITTKVKADLLATDNVSGTDVKVETKNGIVTLTGTVATQAEHDKAVAVAKGIEGVKSVKSTGLKVTAAKK
ncbi:hyperosmotically inducible protein [Xanthomonas arboricola]|uniref:Osmotically-inducible protein Y n=2 Tax=Xanthomonas cannabis TaxID=1885674 RepID=A0AB34P4K4_9XANT|nr:BON domain-containing protein [Xanthomonas cannabis]MCC4610459.1 BON domain-containing protein [Xanthomonas campestris pv. zinniae]MCC4614294.1 BON domain-containing protein [Xanthomonas campestris pv. esculenti]KGK56416.1 membrane protein [Xanthomonas cannabis pv. phaseoli]MBB4595304.1 hyperosmotically inducible protein [Xanthomonas cannabis]MBB5520269.1 hyperosmotically inducible protein [Xanthomonas cannabis]